MTDRCTCSHPWRDHATSCYYCPCYAHSVAVQPAPDTTLHHHNVPNIGTIWFNAAGKVIGGPEDD